MQNAESWLDVDHEVHSAFIILPSAFPRRSGAGLGAVWGRSGGGPMKWA
jgi:hypothetical protein